MTTNVICKRARRIAWLPLFFITSAMSALVACSAGRESEHKRCREGEQHGEEKRRRLGLKSVNDLRHQQICDLDRRYVEREPEQRSGHRVDKGLRQHLANEPQACCAEREPARRSRAAERRRGRAGGR